MRRISNESLRLGGRAIMEPTVAASIEVSLLEHAGHELVRRSESVIDPIRIIVESEVRSKLGE